MEAGRYREWAKNNKNFSIMTKQPTFKESALPLSDLSGTTCQTLIATDAETNHCAVQLRPRSWRTALRQGVQVSTLLWALSGRTFLSVTIIRRQELAKGIGRS